MGPHPGGAPQAMAGPAGNAAMDYLALSRMLATTINHRDHNDAFKPGGGPPGGGPGLTDNKTALFTGKGFDQDQIAKLKDVCGIRNVQQIPPVWSVIQATKGRCVFFPGWPLQYHSHIIH